MLKGFTNIFTFSRYNMILNIISLLVTVLYFCFNSSQDALAFLIQGNAKFLLFTNIYYLLMLFRYRFYSSVKKHSIIRIGEERYNTNIIIFETVYLIIFFIMIYIIGMIILGTDYIFQYWFFIIIYALFLLTIHFIHIVALIWNKNIYRYFLLTYLFSALYNYYLLDLIRSLFFN